MIDTNLTKCYIDGKWVAPVESNSDFVTINPATANPSGLIKMGGKHDADLAVKAARRAFTEFSNTDIEYRCKLLERIIAIYEKRMDDLATAITLEMGAPVTIAHNEQAIAGLRNLKNSLDTLRNFEFVEQYEHYQVVKEPIGVCGLITPWNWPLNQITLKVGPAIAAGCTMVLKPSEYAAFSAKIFAEIIEEAALPNGVFNMVYGFGDTVGAAITAHSDVDFISFTGSLAVGKSIVGVSSSTLKRFALELGGKSANIITPDADLEVAVTSGINSMMINSGQSCSAPSRMLVHTSSYEQVVSIAKDVVSKIIVGNPNDSTTRMGPLVNRKQYDHAIRLIESGVKEGATLIIGGAGSVSGLGDEHRNGYFIQPTIFGDVRNDMNIAREEIFGPVLCIIQYNTIDEAIAIANDSIYGLAADVYAKDVESAHKIATRIRAGNVYINSPRFRSGAPFGGYKQSGIGRESGKYGLEEYLEIKAIIIK